MNMTTFTDDPIDLDDSLACKPGGNQLVKKKKKAGYLDWYQLMENIYNSLLGEALWDYPDLDDFKGKFEDYYNNPPDNDAEVAKKQENLFHGRNVSWIGEKGRMLMVTAEQLSPRDDNIFDFDKMAAVKNYIENSEDRVIFEAPPAQVSIVDLTNIIETQKAFHFGREGDYSISRAFSLGDDDLDLYLASPQDWHEENLYSSYDDFLLFEKDPKLWMKEWSIDENPSEWTDGEKEDYQMMIEEIEEHNKIREEIKKAVENKEGDIGMYWITLRDGNHRAFGALAAGEPYIWVYAIPDMTEDEVELQ